MSSIRWTGEQSKAIENRGGNLLVSAAAGSGKTAVLVERMVQLLLDRVNPVDLDKLLVVTFTEAAAGEMRHRVGSALGKALQEQPDNGLLQRQLFLMPRANIGTLHSFCSEVVRSHFYLLNLDPGFRVMDENEASMLRSEVLEEILEACYEELNNSEHSPFLQLVRSLAGRHGDDRELVELILRLYEFAHSMPRPKAWLESVAEMLERSGSCAWEDQPWIEEWRSMLRLECEGWKQSLEQALCLAQEQGGPSGYVSRLSEEAASVQNLLQLVNGPYKWLKQAMDKLQWPSLPRVAKGECDEEIKSRVKTLRDGVKKRASAIYTGFFSRSTADMAGDLLHVAPQVRALVDATLRFKEAYRKVKLDRAVADFSDLEHYALAVLARNAEESGWGEKPPADPFAPLLPSSVAVEYQEYYTEVLVDEYQDINGVQEAVLRLVSRDNNRFMVGDVKQSIYRFRLADPSVFLGYYNSYQDIDAAGGDSEGHCLDLRSNFRSCPEILNTVNFIFSRIMNEQVAELAYDERARLNCGLEPASGGGEAGSPVELHFLEYSAGQQDSGEAAEGPGEDEYEELDLVRLEARWVSERILKMVTSGETIPDRASGVARPVSWRDIVVLMRSPKGRAGVFLEEFRRLGIPAYADGTGGYFAAPEVQTIVSLLQIIDNPARDIPLAAVLRSPIVGLDAAQLAEIRIFCPEGSFYSAVLKAAAQEGQLNYALAGRLANFLKLLESWRDLAIRTSPAELLEELYRQTGYCDLVGAMPGGAARQANLRALVDRARRFEGTVYRGLFRFLRFIEQIQENGGDMDTARSLGENEDVVRLISVHKSKGLEFPVVVAAGLGRGFNFTDLRKNLLLHRRLGCGPFIIDLERGIRYPTVVQKIIKQRMLLETLAEEMRLLYVALTRAREKLIVTAAVKDLNKTVEKWRNSIFAVEQEGPLSASLLAGAKTPVDWLGTALFSHESLAGIGGNNEAGNRDWRVYLWADHMLAGLRDNSKQVTETENKPWLEPLLRLEPLPEAWLKQQEGIWPGGSEELPDPGELHRRLFWRYPSFELAGLPSKLTVTEWRHAQENLEEDHVDLYDPRWSAARDDNPGELPPGFELPAFYSGDGYNGAERGRVIHLVMQNLALDRQLDENGIEEQLELMVARKILRTDQRKLVWSGSIVRFFKTELGGRIAEAARAGRLWRELPFTTGIPAVDVYPHLEGKISYGETILLQGVIDCMIVDDDGLVIIDYKTDKLTEEQIEQVANRYKIQLELYARAANSITGLPVKEKYLYFFAANKPALL